MAQVACCPMCHHEMTNELTEIGRVNARFVTIVNHWLSDVEKSLPKNSTVDDFIIKMLIDKVENLASLQDQLSNIAEEVFNNLANRQK